MMTCQQFHELLDRYVDGELPVETVAAGVDRDLDRVVLDRSIVDPDLALVGPDAVPVGIELLARVLPRIAVLSHNELPSDVRIVLAGEVRLADAH